MGDCLDACRQERADEMWEKVKPICSLLYYGVGVIVLAWLAYAVVVCCVVFWVFLSNGDKHITDPARYQKCMRDFSGDVVSHFPKTIPIPLDPTRVRFDYLLSGGFGQGGGQEAELWLKLAPAEIDRIYAQFAQKRQPKTLSHFNLRILSQLPVTSATAAMATPDRTLSPPVTPPADEFTVFTLDLMAPYDQWTRGVAINRKRSEIIYFAYFYYAM